MLCAHQFSCGCRAARRHPSNVTGRGVAALSDALHRNLLLKVPKSAQGLVATLVWMIFAQPDAELTRAQHARVVEQLEARWPAAAQLLRDAEADLLAFTPLPEEHWRQIWSNNPQERLNREIKRRTDVVGIFPNRAAIIRLVGAVLAEQHDEWAVVRRYLTLDGLLRPTPDAPALPAAVVTYELPLGRSRSAEAAKVLI